MEGQAGSGAAVGEPDEVGRVVLQTLLVRHPALVAVEELVRDLADTPTRKGVPVPFVEDTINELVRDGLAYRVDRFVFASHSAVRAEALRD